MNQEQNNFDNQYNQSTNVNQTTFNQQSINSQPQPTPNFQHTINQMNMQQPTPQPMNTFESDNVSNKSFNSNQPKKFNLGLIVGIIVVIIVIIVAVIIGTSMINKNDQKDNNKNNNVEQTENNNQEPNDDKTDESEKLLTGTYKVPLKQIYIDAPYYYNYIEEGYTRLFWNKGVSYVTFTYLQTDTVDNLSEAHNIVFKDVKMAVDSHHHLNEHDNLKMEEITVNSIPTLRYEGTTSSGRNPIYDSYTYGYSFIHDGFPCAIIGIVMDESQPQAEKDNVKKIVDAMIKTFRTQK